MPSAAERAPVILRGVSILLLVVTVASLIVRESRAQPDGPKVVDVRVDGARRLTREQVLDGVGVQLDRPLDRARVTQGLLDLHRRYGVRVAVAEEPILGGVRLVFDVSEPTLIRRAEVRGVSGTRAAEFLEQLSLAGVRALLLSHVRDRANELEERLKNEGHAFASVTVEIEGDPADAVAVLNVDEGPKVEIDEVVFEGLESLDGEVARRVMTTQPTRFLLFKSYLRRDVVERDVVEVERLLQREGFRDARVSLARIDLNDDRDEATVVLAVEEGERYHVEAIRIEGNQALSTAELEARLESKAGAPLRTVDLDRDRREMLRRYGELGYIRCEIETQVAFAEVGTGVIVRHVIREGDQKRVRDVVVRGNTSTKDEVVRREVTLEPGELADASELRRTTDRLRALGYFRDEQGRDRVAVQFKPTSDPKQEDLFVDVEETRAGRLYFTGGGSTDIGFFAGVIFDKPNFDASDLPSSWDPITLISELRAGDAFHGGGQHLEIRVIPGNLVSDYLISFTEPYFGGPAEHPLSLNVEAYLRTVNVIEEYQEDRYGLGTTLGTKVDEHLGVGVNARLEVVDIHDVDDAPSEVDDVEGTNFVPAIGLFGRYEDFDDPLDPEEGGSVGVSYDLLLVDAFGERIVFDGSWLVPIVEDARGRKQVLAFRGSLGGAHGFGDDLPFFERLHAGGSSGDFPLRGFEYRRVGPEKQDVHLGGEFAWSTSMEYRFPIYSTYDPLLGEEQEVVRGVVFIDAGSIENSLSSLVSSPRLSTGVGIRVKIPFLGPTPVALDLGVPILKESDDETQLLSVRISTRF